MESVIDNSASTSLNGSKSLVPVAPNGTPTSNTFHWEMNLYTSAFLGAMYYLTPVSHRVFFHVVFALVAIDASRYYYCRGNLAGVPYTFPFVSLVAMVIHPVRYWAELANIAMLSGRGMCASTLVGNFMVFVTDPKLCREIMTTEDTYGIYAHPNALWLFGPKNLIYMSAGEHKDFRALLSPSLFGDEALAMYAAAQEGVMRQHMKRHAMECQETGKPIDARVVFREMAAASSQESFIGPYLDDELRDHLSRDIQLFTQGFLCFPFPYLNSGLHRAIQAKDRIEEKIHKIVPLAREYVQAGNAPRCLMEHWSLAIQTAAKEQGCKSSQEVPYCDDENLARTVLDFLFAAQDATNSAMAYSLDVLAAETDTLDKMRSELEKVVGRNATDAWKQVRDPAALPYTAKVANQLMHHRPPVPMIPHLNRKDSVLGGHAISKGTVVIPSIFYMARVTTHSDEFLPERTDPDTQFVKTMTFGGGQHKCPGRRYAESFLKTFLAVLVDFEFERVGRRPSPNEFMYYPTLFPIDTTFMLTPRAAQKQ
jgi:cytochrome P450